MGREERERKGRGGEKYEVGKVTAEEQARSGERMDGKAWG